MTGFETYSKHRKYGGASYLQWQKTFANEVLVALWKEVCDNKKRITDIDFITYIKDMIKSAQHYRKIDESKVYVFDAYIFTSALYNCMIQRQYLDSVINEDNLPYLFKPSTLDSQKFMLFLSKTKENIKNIEKLERTMTNEDLSTEPDTVHSEGEQLCSNESNSVLEMSNNQDYGTDNDKMNDNLSVASNSSVTVRQEQNENCNVRREENKKVVEKWHEELDEISNTLKNMQPDVSRMLEKIMGFSDDITEKYVLQFARRQIELYDLIHDNYQYHYKSSESSRNQDYMNAVANHQDFLCSISDSLAVFGVEEIISDVGTHFDGKIHEYESNNFSSRSAIIKRSIRSGFRYKDVVIQKEKVEL